MRAAAKNHANVAIVTDPADYDEILALIDEHGAVPLETRRLLALKAFRRTAAYDAAIVTELAARWTPDDVTPDVVPLALRRSLQLRYGENPHQAAALYTIVGADPMSGPFVRGARPLQGKPLSYNNLLDASAVAAVARDLEGDAVVIVKHGNPCGAAEAADLVTAWDRALEADPVSAFGGVVAVRGTVDAALAERLTSIFLEVVVAAGFHDEARDHPGRQAGPATARGRDHPAARAGNARGPSGGWRVAPLGRGRAARRRRRVADGQPPRAVAPGAGRPGVRLEDRAARQVQRHRAGARRAPWSASAPGR